MKGLATRAELEAAGAQVYTVVCPPDDADAFNVRSLADTYRSILDLGRIFGVSERAQRRVAQMKGQIADVREKLSGEPPVKATAYLGGSTGPLDLVGAGLTTELLAAAGAENVFASEQPYFQASLESVAARPVDAFVVFPDFKKATAKPDATDEARFLFKTFPNMPASRNRRVVVTDFVYTEPGWCNAQTVEDLARRLHPDAFAADGPSDAGE